MAKGKTKEAEKNYAPSFEQHGLELVDLEDGKMFKSDCPFCEKENHYFIDITTGQWSCKRCGEDGNLYVFLSKLHELALENTSEGEYGELSEDRGIAVWVLKEWEIAKSTLTDEWLVPSYNIKGSLANLFRWVETDKGNRLFGTKHCKLHPFGTKLLLPDQERVYFTEGPWDGMRLYQALCKLAGSSSKFGLAKNRDVALIQKWGVLSAPGANTFQEEWLHYGNDKENFLLYDSDHPKKPLKGKKLIQPGWQGQERIIKLAGQNGFAPKSLSQIVWGEEGYDPDLADGYDIRDTFSEHGNVAGLRFLLARCQKVKLRGGKSSPKKAKPSGVEEVLIDPLPCTSFTELCKHYADSLHFPQSLRDTLAIMNAVVISTPLPEEQLWFRIIGPPSCLSGDTVVTVNRAGKSFKIKMKDLYYRFHGGKAGGKIWREDISTTIQSMMEDRIIRLRTLVGVVYSGKKTVYEVTTRSGKKIKASMDHKFLTVNGWKRLKQLTVGSHLLTDQGQKKGSVRKQKKNYERTGLVYHPHAVKKEERYREKGSHRVLLHRLLVEAEMNRTTLDTFIHNLRTNPVHGYRFLSPKQPVHHKDENHNNNDLSNLEACKNQSDHNRKHNFANNVLYHCLPDKIVSIKKVGIEEVYDLVVDKPNNFLANGIVVHNSGKTTLAENICADKEHTFANSIQTGIHSGYVSHDDAEGQDNSLIPYMQNKTTVIKDADTLVNSGKRDTILSDLRDIYDRTSRATYRNKIRHVYENLNMTFLLCGTDDLRSLNRTFLGERFLDCEILDEGADTSAYVDRAIKNTYSSLAASLQGIKEKKEDGKPLEDYKLHLKQYTYGFLKHLFENLGSVIPVLPVEVEDTLKAYARLLTFLRARVKRDKDELSYRPRAELAPRLTKQFTKLALCLAIVLNKETIDDEVMRICKKVLMDTAKGFHLETIDILYKYSIGGRPGLTADVLASKLNLSKSQVSRYLKDMQEFRMVQRNNRPNNSGIRGRNVHYWILTKPFKALYKTALVENQS